MNRLPARPEVSAARPTAETVQFPVVGPGGRKYYQFTAIDDCTRPWVVQIYPQSNHQTAIQSSRSAVVSIRRRPPVRGSG
jgi:hypothetical protein